MKLPRIGVKLSEKNEYGWAKQSVQHSGYCQSGG